MANALLEESHTAPKVIVLYCYPVNGFTPEVCKQLTILPGGRVAGDRVLYFRFADAPVAEILWPEQCCHITGSSPATGGFHSSVPSPMGREIAYRQF